LQIIVKATGIDWAGLSADEAHAFEAAVVDAIAWVCRLPKGFVVDKHGRNGSITLAAADGEITAFALERAHCTAAELQSKLSGITFEICLQRLSARDAASFSRR
jgi:hypothetical protein